MNQWDAENAGVLRLPSGRLIRGRALRAAVPPGPPPTFGVYLLGRKPSTTEWESRWIKWPDFWLPSDRSGAAEILYEAWERSGSERVEIACGGGRGRTGTALALVAVFDGLDQRQAVAYVRDHYCRHAVETPWQRRFVARFQRPGTSGDQPPA